MLINKFRELVVVISMFTGIMLVGSCLNQESTYNSQPENFDSFKLKVLEEINLARTNPGVYAIILEEMKTHYRGKLYRVPGHMPIQTQEGVKAVDEAIEYLKNIQSRHKLVLNSGLNLSAIEHIKDTGPRGITGHYGTDGSSPGDRMSRHGKWKFSYSWGENITYGPSTPREIVAQLIIDDGIPDRGHRENLFNSNFTQVGIAIGSHKVYRYMCVMDLANGFIDKSRKSA